MSTEKGMIVNEGMGGFLNPPTHPEHGMSVMFDLRRRRENRGSMSLSSAVACEWLDPLTRERAKSVLDGWKAPAIESPEVAEWIRSVLGYFRSCYRNPAAGEREWHASDMLIDANRDPLAFDCEHAGVHLIRKYYPDFVPTADDFALARWGA